MKRPTRPTINGTAILLLVIALSLILTLLCRRCDSNGTVPGPAAPVETGIAADSCSSDTSAASKRPDAGKHSRRKAGGTKREPKVYPRRSPLDEPVSP